ncbi:MAG: hypothetical protein ACXAC7_06840 [Candidatus Hodarchaeales archaeon]
MLQALQVRSSLGLKPVLTNNNLEISYRQSLRRITELYEQGVIQSWIPLIHPQALGHRKYMWFWLRTNPQKSEELDFFKAKQNILSLDGITGTFSLVALFRFNSDQEFLDTLEVLGQQFSVIDPHVLPMRYLWREILAYHKIYGIPTPATTVNLSETDKNLIDTLIKLGDLTDRPPSVKILANNMNKANSTIQRNLKRLEQKQAILGYGVKLNPNLRPNCKFIVQIQVDTRYLPKTIQLLIEDPQVHLLCRIQDTYSLLAIVYTDNITQFNEWLKGMYEHQEILDSMTAVVLNEEIKDSYLALGFPL